MIELTHVSVGYGEDTVLSDLSLSLPTGRFYAIVGPNGSGKSTLLKTAVGILPCKSGSVLLDGTPVSSLSPNAVARCISYLSQSRAVPDMTVAQLVLHGRFPHLHYPRRYKKHDFAIADECMRRLGVFEYRNQLLSACSGGMRQNAYLAMALAQSTQYLLLDEPTTYLDVSHQTDLMHTLKSLVADGKTVVAVLHDLPLALTFADEIVVLNEGKIIASAPPNEIDASVLKSVFSVPVRHENGTYFYDYSHKS